MATVLRASVTADALSLNPGDPAPILVDGADTAITANGLAGYAPMAGDRLLVTNVQGSVEVVQFVSTGSVPFVSTYSQSTAPSTVTTPLGAIWYDTSLTGQGRPNRLQPDPTTGVATWTVLTLGGAGLDTPSVRKSIVESGFTLGGGNSAFLANGTSAPTLNPVLSSYYPTMNSAMYNGGLDTSASTAGLETYHADSTKWVHASILFGTGIQLLNKSDMLVATADLSAGKAWESNFLAQGGIARTGSQYYLLGTDNNRSGDWYIYNIDGTTWSKVNEQRITSVTGFHGVRPALVGDTPNNRVGMVWVTGAGDLLLRWFNASTLAQVGSDITLKSSVGTQDVGDAVLADAGSGLGTQTLWVALRTSTTLPNVMCWGAVTTTSATRQTTFDFPRASVATFGMSYDSTSGHFVSYNRYGVAYTYSAVGAAATSLAMTGRYTWYDSVTGTYPAGTFINGVDVSGTASTTHETTYSPTTSLTLPRRAWPRFTLPVLPPDYQDVDPTHVDKANMAGVYIALGGGTMWRQVYTSVGQSVVDSFETFPGSGTPAPNDFSTAVAGLGSLASIAADTGFDGFLNKIVLRGDGTFRLGSYDNVRHFGTMSQNATATNVTGGAGGTTLNWTVQVNVPSGLSYSSGFVIAKPGLYQVAASIFWAIAQTTGTRGVQVRKNGTIVFQNNFDMADLDSGSPVQPITCLIPCVATDVITVTASSSVTTTVIGGDSTRSWFQVGFIGT